MTKGFPLVSRDNPAGRNLDTAGANVTNATPAPRHPPQTTHPAASHVVLVGRVIGRMREASRTGDAKWIAKAHPATYAGPIVENDSRIESSLHPGPTRVPVQDLDARAAPDEDAAVAGEAAGDTDSYAASPMWGGPAEAESDNQRLERLMKVQKLKAAIADGSYETDPESVARKILERGL